MFGGIKLTLDNKDFNFTDKMSYRGVLFEGIPNMAMVFGYTNSSWTLKSDLIGDWVCRLLKHMDKTGKKQVVPVNTDSTIGRLSFIRHEFGLHCSSERSITATRHQRPVEVKPKLL